VTTPVMMSMSPRPSKAAASASGMRPMPSARRGLSGSSDATFAATASSA